MIKDENHSVGARFSKAARHYQQHNHVQRQTREQLLATLQHTQIKQLVDIGCGPGSDFSVLQPANVSGIDIAAGMLQQCQRQYPHYQIMAGRAEQLPVLNNIFDCYYSNLALQWCDDMPAVVSEAYRVLRPHGELAVAIVVDGSLAELDHLGLQKRQFQAEKCWIEQFAIQPWQRMQWQQCQHTCYFADLKSLLYSIKGVGASSVTQTAGLKGKEYWQRLNGIAESMRQANGLPLTYQILYISAKK